MNINDLVLKVNDVLTGSVLIIALVGIGLLFTFKLGFIQIRGFKDGWNRTFGGFGSVHFSECQRSSQKRLWLRSSSKSVMTEP